jgi:hypothetical protein
MSFILLLKRGFLFVLNRRAAPPGKSGMLETRDEEE